MNIAVFASHGGSDLQAIIDGCKNGNIDATVAVVISNNRDSMALQRSNDVGAASKSTSPVMGGRASASGASSTTTGSSMVSKIRSR